MKNKEMPVFVKKDVSRDNKTDLSDLGVELSTVLPTYDVPLSLIEPNSWNVNSMDDKTFNRLVEEMETTGIIDAIQIVPAAGGKFRIIGGEHRWHGAKALSWKTIPANVLTDKKFLDEDLQKFLSIRLNVIRGEPAPEKFTALYEQMVDTYGADQLKALFGFTSSDAWGKLTKGVTASLKAAGFDASFVKDVSSKSKNVKTVDGLGGILKNLFKKYGEDLQHSFMVFVYGGKTHMYVSMNKELSVIIKKIADTCRKDSVDIADVMVDALRDIPEGIAKTKKEDN